MQANGHAEPQEPAGDAQAAAAEAAMSQHAGTVGDWLGVDGGRVGRLQALSLFLVQMGRSRLITHAEPRMAVTRGPW